VLSSMMRKRRGEEAVSARMSERQWRQRAGFIGAASGGREREARMLLCKAAGAVIQRGK
jgi:hypothetical protein